MSVHIWAAVAVHCGATPLCCSKSWAAITSMTLTLLDALCCIALHWHRRVLLQLCHHKKRFGLGLEKPPTDIFCDLQYHNLSPSRFSGGSTQSNSVWIWCQTRWCNNRVRFVFAVSSSVTTFDPGLCLQTTTSCSLQTEVNKQLIWS